MVLELIHLLENFTVNFETYFMKKISISISPT